VKQAEEQKLIEGFRQGDYTCFEKLVGENERKIYNLALRMLGNADDAFDILQDTFLKVYGNIDKFRGDARLSTWMYRIAMNEALMKIRREKGKMVSLDTFKVTEGEVRSLDIEDWAQRPLDKLLTKELGERMEAAVSLLPEDYRAVFLLRDVEGLSNAEIAEILEISVPAVKSRLHRARLFLRGELSKYFAREKNVH
jgi:RNA polymerase sigma-70 factor (ECF subfamily)